MTTESEQYDGGRPGFSLYETLRWKARGGYELLAEHMHRLQDSAAYFCWNIDIGAVTLALKQARDAFQHSDQRVRVEVSRTGQVNVTHSPFTPLPNTYHVRLAPNPVDSANPLLRHKTTCRDVYDEARAAAGSCDDVLLWNQNGEITESCRANILVEKQGSWLTPSLNCGMLNGIARQQLLDLREVQESIIDKDYLLAADSIWLVNSVRGRWKAELILQESYGNQEESTAISGFNA